MKETGSFKVVGSFKVGVGSVSSWAVPRANRGEPYYIHHPTRCGIAVNLTPLDLQSKYVRTDLQLDAYMLAKRLIDEIDPDWAAGEFVVQFAYMNDGDCPQHVRSPAGLRSRRASCTLPLANRSSCTPTQTTSRTSTCSRWATSRDAS